MVLLEKLWDDVVSGPKPDQHRLSKLRTVTVSPLIIKDHAEAADHGSTCKYQRLVSIPAPSPTGNMWKSMRIDLNPTRAGSKMASKGQGSIHQYPNSSKVYDWLYSEDTKNKHHDNAC